MIRFNLNFVFQGFLVLIVALSFFLNLNSYPGQKYLFFFFNIITLSLFFTLYKFKVSYFELFFFILLILGFWFKLFFILYSDDYLAYEGDFKLITDKSRIGKIYDETLIVIIFAFLACLIGCRVRKFFEKKLFKFGPVRFSMKKKFKNFYKINRFRIMFFFIIFLVTIWFLNYNYKIYSKGIVNNEIPILLNYIFAWLFNYGLSVFAAMYIFIDFYVFREKKIIFIGIFETFFSNISILSRAFALVFLVYLKGFIDTLKDYKSNLNVKNFFLKISFFGAIFFLISLFIVNEIRGKTFFIGNKSNIEKKIDLDISNKITNNFIDFKKLAVERWVGIDSLLSVSNYPYKNIDLFLESLKEKKLHREQSFYMKNFYTNFVFEKNANENLNTVILPGIIAFLYYSGSKLLVFLGIIFFIVFFSLIEKFFWNYSQNRILSSIIGFTLAMRLAHFGYLPVNTIQYLFSLLITFFIVFFISSIFLKFEWKR